MDANISRLVLDVMGLEISDIDKRNIIDILDKYENMTTDSQSYYLALYFVKTSIFKSVIRLFFSDYFDLKSAAHYTLFKIKYVPESTEYCAKRYKSQYSISSMLNGDYFNDTFLSCRTTDSEGEDIYDSVLYQSAIRLLKKVLARIDRVVDNHLYDIIDRSAFASICNILDSHCDYSARIRNKRLFEAAGQFLFSEYINIDNTLIKDIELCKIAEHL